MKTFVVLALHAHRLKADGTCPIVLRIIHRGESSQFATGVYVRKEDWDKQGRRIKRSYRGTQSVTLLNNKLEKEKATALDLINRLDEQKKLNSLSVSELKELIQGKPVNLSFYGYTEKVIAQLRESNRIGNAIVYETMLGVLKSFHGDTDLAFHELDFAFITTFETAHFKKGNSTNGLATYLRTIRAVFNRAIKEEVIDANVYPFKRYRIATTKTRKRAISPEAMNRIIAESIPAGDPLFHARNFFLASYYMRGMSFFDLAELRLSNIVDGRIKYERKKTGAQFDIKITSEMQVLLDYYTQGKAKTNFIFPIIKRETVEDQHKDVVWARKRFNQKLRKLATRCNIEQNLTSYVSRHTFASKAKNLGVSTESIGQMLGHKELRTTEIYLDSLPSDLLDDIHEKVVK